MGRGSPAEVKGVPGKCSRRGDVMGKGQVVGGTLRVRGAERRSMWLKDKEQGVSFYQ